MTLGEIFQKFYSYGGVYNVSRGLEVRYSSATYFNVSMALFSISVIGKKKRKKRQISQKKSSKSLAVGRHDKSSTLQSLLHFIFMILYT